VAIVTGPAENGLHAVRNGELLGYPVRRGLTVGIFFGTNELYGNEGNDERQADNSQNLHLNFYKIVEHCTVFVLSPMKNIRLKPKVLAKRKNMTEIEYRVSCAIHLHTPWSTDDQDCGRILCLVTKRDTMKQLLRTGMALVE
jgi:hypothetical protein